MGKVHPLVALVSNILLDRAGLQPQRGGMRTDQLPEIGDIPAIRELIHKEGTVTLILGRRESGKTVLCYRLAEILGRPTYAVSPEQSPPQWVQELELKELSERPPRRTTLCLDDVATYMSSRDYQDPLVQVVEKIIPVVRHRRKIHLIFSSQLASLADKYILDVDLLILKPPSPLFADIERPTVKKLQDSITEVWKDKSDRWVQRHCYVYTHKWAGLAKVDMYREEKEEVLSLPAGDSYSAV